MNCYENKVKNQEVINFDYNEKVHIYKQTHHKCIGINMVYINIP